MELVTDFIKKCRGLKVLVVGDLMLDQFIWGKVDRISPEAPVPVVQVTEESSYPGGAANVARNLCEFGIKVHMSGMIGTDENGDKLMDLLASSQIASDSIVSGNNFQTIVKTRIIARQQQVVRVDWEQKSKLSESEILLLKKRLAALTGKVDAVIVEDYGKGFVTQDVVRIILDLFPHCIIAVDPNSANPLDYSGTTVVKPNRSEAFALAQIADENDDIDIETVGEKLLAKWKVKHLLITLGEDGILLFDPPGRPFHSPTKAREVYDVSGAGDTTIALFTSALAAGFSPLEATEIANHAAGIVVGKLGTATLTPQELLASFGENNE